MPELTFSLAKRFYKHRGYFAHACKTNLLPVAYGTEYRDERLGILALPFFPRSCDNQFCSRMLTESQPRIQLDDGWWSNGFAVLRSPPASYLEGSRYDNSLNLKPLFLAGEEVVLGCLLYYQPAQESPLVALMSETQAMLFHPARLDSLFAVVARRSVEIRLTFNESGGGVILSAGQSPLGYLARLAPAEVLSAALLAHARKYYAHCRN